MECPSCLFWLFFFFFIFSSTGNLPHLHAFQAIDEKGICPAKEDIQPCTCTTAQGKIDRVECKGNSITQGQIDYVFTKLRAVNGKSRDDPLFVKVMYIFGTDLTQLDLTPFHKLHLDLLHIISNDKLTRVKSGLVGRNEAQLTINANRLAISHCSQLQDAGLRDTLFAFSTQMTELGLNGNQIRGSEEEGVTTEFLPGLSALTNLKEINLGFNKVVNLGVGRFRKNNKLTYLRLAFNSIKKLEENVFLFTRGASEDANGEGNSTLVINLRSCGLSESSFPRRNLGVEGIGRAVSINLYRNQLVSFPMEPFKAFLFAHKGNTVDLEGNPLRCDERSLWLQTHPESVRDAVKNAECSNLPGKSLQNFTLSSSGGAASWRVLRANFIPLVVLFLGNFPHNFKYKESQNFYDL